MDHIGGKETNPLFSHKKRTQKFCGRITMIGIFKGSTQYPQPCLLQLDSQENDDNISTWVYRGGRVIFTRQRWDNT